MRGEITNPSAKIAIVILIVTAFATLYASNAIAQTPTPVATPTPTPNSGISQGSPQEGISITRRATIAAEATRKAQRGS